MRVHCVELKCETFVLNPYRMCLLVEACRYLKDKTIKCHLDFKCRKSKHLKLEKNAKLNIWTKEISNCNANA